MKRFAKETFWTASFVFVTSSAAASPKPMITYFQPMPIVGQLSTTVWGASTVGARDPANGLEDNGAAGGVGPQQETYFYWDGKILHGNDGKYHLFAVHWLHSNGFGPPAGGSTGWQQSIPMESVSDSAMGPYVSQGDCYSKNEEGNDLGHNLTALIAPTGTSPYTLSVGEIVPGQMFNSSSPNGPWTVLGFTQTNTNGHSGCGSTSSNFAFTVGPDNRFWATSRAGCVMDSDQVLGPYKIETDSILPNLENNDNGNAEDECIWYSGGYYHIVYNYWNVQRAYHIMSKDGTTNWTSTGLAYAAAQSPSNSNSNWLRYTDGTVNVWHNMERVGVLVENGHPTHFTFAVTDVNKNANGVSQGGSKILVVPFNGVQFDCDNGDPTSCAEVAAADGGPGGPIDSGSDDGVVESGGDSSVGDATVSRGAEGGGGGADGSIVAGDAGGTGESGGARDTGGAEGGDEVGDHGAAGDSGSSDGGGLGALLADAGSVTGDGSVKQSSGQNGGCGCMTAARTDSMAKFAWFGGVLLAGALIHRRRWARTSGSVAGGRDEGSPSS